MSIPLLKPLNKGKINNPVVVWVSGTCARVFKSEVQFGHAVSFYLNFLCCFTYACVERVISLNQNINIISDFTRIV